MSNYHLVGYTRYTVNFCDEADRLSELGPWSEAGVFNTEKEARECLDRYLRDYPSIYKWEIIMSRNGMQTIIVMNEKTTLTMMKVGASLD
jgi:hypothetical protein